MSFFVLFLFFFGDTSPPPTILSPSLSLHSPSRLSSDAIPTVLGTVWSQHFLPFLAFQGTVSVLFLAPFFPIFFPLSGFLFSPENYSRMKSGFYSSLRFRRSFFICRILCWGRLSYPSFCTEFPPPPFFSGRFRHFPLSPERLWFTCSVWCGFPSSP